MRIKLKAQKCYCLKCFNSFYKPLTNNHYIYFNKLKKRYEVFSSKSNKAQSDLAEFLSKNNLDIYNDNSKGVFFLEALGFMSNDKSTFLNGKKFCTNCGGFQLINIKLNDYKYYDFEELDCSNFERLSQKEKDNLLHTYFNSVLV